MDINKEDITLSITEERMHDTQSGFLRTHRNHTMLFDGKQWDFICGFIGEIERDLTMDTYEYSINIWIYTYKREYGIVLFWVPLKGKYYLTGTYQEEVPTWWAYVRVRTGNRYTVFSCDFGATGSFLRESYIPFEQIASWQYFSFRYKAESSTGLTPSATDVSVSYYDNSGVLSSEYLTDVTPSSRSLIGDGFFFFKYNNSGSFYYYHTGMVYKIQFHNTLNDGNPYNSRSDFVNAHKDDYVYFF